jgi:hypothetical protein
VRCTWASNESTKHASIVWHSGEVVVLVCCKSATCSLWSCGSGLSLCVRAARLSIILVASGTWRRISVTHQAANHGNIFLCCPAHSSSSLVLLAKDISSLHSLWFLFNIECKNLEPIASSPHQSGLWLGRARSSASRASYAALTGSRRPTRQARSRPASLRAAVLTKCGLQGSCIPASAICLELEIIAITTTSAP